MKNITLTLTPAHAVAFMKTPSGAETIVDMCRLHIFKIPKRSAVGRTGADIKWLAYADAVITQDLREDNDFTRKT